MRCEPPPDFARDVVPILEANCLRCHNASKVEGGLLLESHEDLMRGGDSGSPLVPGKPDESPFILQIEGRAKPKMPPKKDLPPDEVAVLRAWVLAGAPYSKAARVSIDEKVPALSQTAAVLPQVKSGRLRAIAVTTAKRIPALPDVPTVMESGVKGYEVILWHGLIGPKSLPRPIVERVNAELNKALKAKDMEDKLAADGVSAAGGTPEQFASIIKRDIEVWRKVVQQANIKPE